MNNQTTKDQSMERAFERYKRIRSCPPLSAFLSASTNENVFSHAKQCPACSKLLRATKGLAQDNNRETHFHFTRERKQEQREFIPGQIWTIKKSLGNWTNGALYYNPPHVLILEANNHTVIVAQTYGDSKLRCPGEVPLGEDVPGFAEPWNVYTLEPSHLGYCQANVDMGVVFQVLMMIKHKFGDELNEYQQNFRQLETDIGHVIAAQSQEALIKKLLDERDTLFADITGGELHEHHYAKGIGSRLDMFLGDGEIQIYRPVAKEWLTSVKGEFQQIVDKYNESHADETVPQFIAFTQEVGGHQVDVWNAAKMDKLAQKITSSSGARSAGGKGLKETETDLQKLNDYLNEHPEINWYPATMNRMRSGERLVIGLFHRDFDDYLQDAAPQAPLPDVTIISDLKGLELVNDSLNPEPSRYKHWFVLDLFARPGNLFPKEEEIGIIIQESKENPNQLTLTLKKLPTE